MDERRRGSAKELVVASTRVFDVTTLVDVVEGKSASIESRVVVAADVVAVLCRPEMSFLFFRPCRTV